MNRPSILHLAFAAVAVLLATVARAENPPAPPRSIADIADSVKPCVVGVDAYQTVPKGLWIRTRNFLNPFPLRSFISDTLSLAFYVPRAVVYPFSTHRQGAGFILDADGYIATSAHVIHDCNHFYVWFIDGSVAPAKVIAVDDFADIALLQADLTGVAGTVHAATLGDSDAVRVGDWAMAVGHPLGLDYSVTTGIVNGLSRAIGVAPLEDLIQIDAALDGGNSGGPIVNAGGEVIGIAEASFFLAQNKNFAVPINMLKSVLDDMKATGGPQRGEIGVIVENPASAYAKSLGLESPAGALVVDVESHSPGAAAGLQRGDVVVGYAGGKVAGACQLVRLVRASRPGTACEIEVLRPAARAGDPPFKKTLHITPNLIETHFQVF